MEFLDSFSLAATATCFLFSLPLLLALAYCAVADGIKMLWDAMKWLFKTAIIDFDRPAPRQEER